jgi:hypothetical protein
VKPNVHEMPVASGAVTMIRSSLVAAANIPEVTRTDTVTFDDRMSGPVRPWR